MSEFILKVKGLTKAFGGLVALNNVDLAIRPGELAAVIGPNGAGKTTLFNIVAGVYAPTRGEVVFGGRTLSHRVTPAQRARLGIARTFQHVYLFNDMSALENVEVGRHTKSRTGFVDAGFRLPNALREEDDIRLEAIHFLNMVEQGRHAELMASGIPLGQQKLVAIGRALATEPKLLLLDEPGAGLNAMEKKGLSDLIKRIRDTGITVILVEHDMELVMGTAERVIVLDCGEKIAEGTPRQVQHDRRVIAAYLGEEDRELE